MNIRQSGIINIPRTRRDYTISIFCWSFAKGHFNASHDWRWRKNSFIGWTIHIDRLLFIRIFIWPTARVVHLRHSFVSFSLWPTILHRTHDLACVETRESEREDEQEKEQERRERENNYSAIVTTANQNTYTFIHTDAYTSISLLQIIRSRSRTRTLLRVKKRKSMPADRFAPYPLPAHISHSEYRKVREYHEKEIDDWSMRRKKNARIPNGHLILPLECQTDYGKTTTRKNQSKFRRIKKSHSWQCDNECKFNIQSKIFPSNSF